MPFEIVRTQERQHTLTPKANITKTITKHLKSTYKKRNPRTLKASVSRTSPRRRRSPSPAPRQRPAARPPPPRSRGRARCAACACCCPPPASALMRRRFQKPVATTERAGFIATRLWYARGCRWITRSHEVGHRHLFKAFWFIVDGRKPSWNARSLHQTVTV